MWLFFVRHGQPDYTLDCLTDYGKKQAKALSERLKSAGIEKIFASTMGRAKETAGFTAEKFGLTVETLDFASEDYAGKEFVVIRNGFKDWSFNDKESLRTFLSDEVSKLGGKWYDSPLFKDTEYKNGTLRVKNAVVEFLGKLGYRYDEKTQTYTAVKHLYDKVAFFAHGGFGMIFMSCLLNIPYPEFCTRFHYIGQSAITVIKIADEGDMIIPQVYQYGSDAHLYKENLIDGFDLKVY